VLFITIILDGVGIGAQPDADQYGDAGTHTLGHICETARPRLPHLVELGLGNITSLTGIPAATPPRADFGRMKQTSAGKDSISGHWELAGVRLDRPFPTYPDGFPQPLIQTFLEKTGYEAVIGNKPASGTDIITELGIWHQESGHPIVYTSADSVFQVAAHRKTIDLEELYRICEITRKHVCIGRHAVGRVIARPFDGPPGAYQRISSERKDYACRPPETTIQEVLQQHGIQTIAVGKIYALFAGTGFDESYDTKSNELGIAESIRQITLASEQSRPTFIWVNLVDFDQNYGHRNDVTGFACSLEAFDASVPSLLERLPEGSCLTITADHGNDPTDISTDHTREYVPLLVYHGFRKGHSLGIRASFADHAASIAAFFQVPYSAGGSSFL